MSLTLKPEKDVYTEQEAIEVLGISAQRLHTLLDLNVFNDGSAKPATLTFRAQDLVMIGYWDRALPNQKVVRMPRR